MAEPTKFYWKIIKFCCEISPLFQLWTCNYISKITFYVRETMAKTNKERQAKRKTKGRQKSLQSILVQQQI